MIDAKYLIHIYNARYQSIETNNANILKKNFVIS